MTSISFRCRSCGQEAQDPAAHGAAICGHARSVCWLAVEPGPDPGNPRLLERAPGKSENHWLAVRFPFRADAAQPFWCLFKPPMSRVNGWEDQPHEIAESSLLHCRLLEIEDAGADAARVRVKIIHALPVTGISREIPVSAAPGDPFELFEGTRTGFARCDDFLYFSFSMEGDAGAWAIVERREARYFSILHGDWSWHADWFHAENRLLGEAEAEIVNRIAGRRRG